MVLENIFAKMEEVVKGNGLTIRCMGNVYTNGQMDKYMMDITKKIKNMDMVLLFGIMERSMLEIGFKINNMEKDK